MQKNRNGIAVFDNNADLYKAFIREDPLSPNGDLLSQDEDQHGSSEPDKCRDLFWEKGEAQKTVREDGRGVSRNSRDFPEKNAGSNDKDLNVSENKLEKLRKDKHGLPFLDGAGSLSKLFRDEIRESGEEAFPELLEASLKGKGRAAMMREKKDSSSAGTAVPLKKRLKRYPPVQSELDLHGYTAMEAQSRSEAWLRRLWRNGFFTVRIIVGKGLHSEFGAVLPDVVEDLLNKLKREGVVLWFEWDRKQKSRSGAVIAYLNQFD